MKLKIVVPFTKKIPDGASLARRKSFELNTFKRGFYFGIFSNYLSNHDNKWYLGNGYHSITISFNPKGWMFGSDHSYYDGPHCSFAMGPIRFNWQGDHCSSGDCYK